MREKLTKEYIGTREMVEIFYDMIKDNPRENVSCPKFSKEEAVFITKLLFHKPYNLVAPAVADFLSEKYFAGSRFTNAAAVKRILFFNFFLIEGSATKAAIKAGYSKKCAKQQGYRVLRWIREHLNDSIQ